MLFSKTYGIAGTSYINILNVIVHNFCSYIFTYTLSPTCNRLDRENLVFRQFSKLVVLGGKIQSHVLPKRGNGRRSDGLKLNFNF